VGGAEEETAGFERGGDSRGWRGEETAGSGELSCLHAVMRHANGNSVADCG
jgi:hypothetical protein